MGERLTRLAWLPPVVLVGLLAAASLLPIDERLRLESGDPTVAQRWTEQLDALPADAEVLVGFDPDLGTYAEIRPTVRVLLADLLNRDARLAFVSLTPEGRALGLAELDRMARLGTNPTRLADLGFVPGAEAALVSLARQLPAVGELNAFGRRLVEGGLAEVDLILIVGGNDLGPRSWVEQVAPRIGEVPMVAVAPVVLLPELHPYVATGQLDALAATPRDGAAYRATSELGRLERLAVAVEPSVGAILVGLAVALVVLGQALLARVPRPGASREPR
ncbi:MAG TPA: hypothetical protein VM253_00950 [Candidatus Limnocylindrales bacterium]|nr:hypothetical protein [Candidatus Limnocylindrales bacterium]